MDELHPADVADILEQLDPAQRLAVFQHLDDERAGDAISEMEDEYQADVIDDLDDARASKLLGNMDPDDAADIVRDLPYEKAERLLRLMGVEDAEDIRKLLGYRDETAGGMMTTQFVAMHEDDTVGEAIDTMRALDEDFPTIHYLYVLNDYEKLVGVLSLRTRWCWRRIQRRCATMFDDDLITALPDEPEADVADDISKYNLVAIPVVNEHGRMLGIVTFDDALDVIEDDADETKSSSNTLRTVLFAVGGVLFLVIYTLVVLQIVGFKG